VSYSYKDLIAWQKAMDLAEAIYQLTRDFPREEIYGLTSQLRRCAVSVPSNIAEGQGRTTPGEFKQFLGHARGSLLELETQLQLAKRLGYCSADREKALLMLSTEVGPRTEWSDGIAGNSKLTT
jgi:four helix bundle protein